MGSHKKRSVGSRIGAVFANIGRVIAALIMVGIITGCIIAAVLTVYILRYINADEQISLDNLDMQYTTIIYAQSKETGEYEELQRLQTAVNRIWVDYDDIPQYMKDATIAIEDKRFWEHNGVDWKRTFGAFVNMFIPIYSGTQGGSTIHQQLIKNITGDNEVRIERKVQEIFRALNLNKRYSKEQVLEAYLNTIFFSNQSYGVQAAANTYFGKDVSELSLAECASIIGITNAPTAYNPFLYPENNKKRQEQILFEMHDQGMITDEEYEDAVNEKLVFQTEIVQERIAPVYSYFVDHVIEEIIDDLVEEKGYTYERAQQMVNSEGLRIYATVDTQMQDYVTEYYSDVSNFPPVGNAEYPQSACVITDTNGKILALAGGIGEKKGLREFSRATQALRQCGSSIKPIAAYLQAIENDVATWSTMYEDGPIQLNGESWPVNHYGKYLGPITIDEAIQRSTNTIPVKLVELLTPRRVFDFLHDKLGMESLVDRKVVNGQVLTDVDIFPMALGGLTMGVSPLEMAGAYQIYANGGYYTEPYAYTTVTDADGNVILEKDTTPRRVISAETATIVNKLMQRVVYGPYGTGSGARFQQTPGITVAGKTGTTDEDKDQWFMGITPYYVTAIWLGFDEPERIIYGNYPPPLIYRQIMEPLHQGLEPKDFPIWGEVVQETYCTESGDLAGDDCTSTAVGWYKKSYLPGTCTIAHGTESIDLDEEDGGNRSESGLRLPGSRNDDEDDDDSPRVIENDD